MAAAVQPLTGYKPPASIARDVCEMNLDVNFSSDEELPLANAELELSQETEMVRPIRHMQGTKRKADQGVDEVNPRPRQVQRKTSAWTVKEWLGPQVDQKSGRIRNVGESYNHTSLDAEDDDGLEVDISIALDKELSFRNEELSRQTEVVRFRSHMPGLTRRLEVGFGKRKINLCKLAIEKSPTTIDYHRQPTPVSKALLAKEKWERNLNFINRQNPLFFSTRDARLSRSSMTWKKGKVYEGVGATKHNCLALAKLYDVFYKPVEGLNQEHMKEFQRLANTVSQFLRLCVARELCLKHSLYKMSILFQNSADLELVQRFLDFHVECFSSKTVERKARHLKLICMIAPIFLSTSQRQTDTAQVSQYLDVIIKAKGRQMGSPIVERQFIQPVPLSSIKLWFYKARSDLDSMIASYKSKKFRKKLLDEYQFLKRWLAGFVTFVAICSGGQNPLTISTIEIPRDKDCEDVLERAAKNGFVQLPTLLGKRTQALGLPEVVLPVFTIPILRFHFNVVHPMIKSLTKMSTSTGHFRALIVDESTGHRMEPWKVTYLFKKFIAGRTDLHAINLSSLGRSALHMLMKGFRERRLFKAHSEGQVLDVLARYQNTSAIQVKKRVGVRGSAEYEAAAKQLTKFLAIS